MSTDKAFGEALDKLIPKSLGEVITEHREHAELRIATEDDLEPLVFPVDYNCFAEDIADWTFVTLDWHPPGRPDQLITSLFGYNIDRHQQWTTSEIVAYDEMTSCVRTRSGSIYRMVDERSETPDLLRVCAWVHTTKIGKYLGVLHVFY